MEFKEEKEFLIRELKNSGTFDLKVLEAIYNIPREVFVPEFLKDRAYENVPLPIGEGQTISQPFMVAYMTQHLEIFEGCKVLEIGTGSGYQAGILSYLGCEVYTIERIDYLSKKAKENLKKASEVIGKDLLKNIKFFIGDGSLGFKNYAPYDRIIITAAAIYNKTQTFIEQLSDNNGILIVPEGKNLEIQILRKYIKNNGKIEVIDLDYCRFVPLIGENGWQED